MAWRGNPRNPVPNFVQQPKVEQSEVADTINRAEQVRRDTDKQKNFTVSLMDIDSTIANALEKFKLTVVDNGSQVKVPVYYANPERWKSIQKDGFIRDYNGKMILPAIVFKRVNSEKDMALTAFNRYLNYPVLKKYSEKNRYTPFNLLIGKNVPINDVYDVKMPDHMIFTYHFIIWAEKNEQVNNLVERFIFESEDYWGDLKGLRFRTEIPSFAHTIELQVDQDRIVKTEFDLAVHGYILPDIMETMQGTKSTTQKRFTPKKVVMGMEVVATDYDFNNLDDNREKWRNQNYPNQPADEIIPTAPITFVDISEVRVGTTPLSIWTLPAPQNSSDSGVAGQISYDDEYYYVYTTVWKRAPKVLVNEISTVIGEKKWLSFDNDYIYILGDLDRIPMSLFNIF
jgi:hypothetical protein